jgi:hypothetical protein
MMNADERAKLVFALAGDDERLTRDAAAARRRAIVALLAELRRLVAGLQWVVDAAEALRSAGRDPGVDVQAERRTVELLRAWAPVLADMAEL